MGILASSELFACQKNKMLFAIRNGLLFYRYCVRLGFIWQVLYCTCSQYCLLVSSINRGELLCLANFKGSKLTCTPAAPSTFNAEYQSGHKYTQKDLESEKKTCLHDIPKNIFS